MPDLVISGLGDFIKLRAVSIVLDILLGCVNVNIFVEIVKKVENDYKFMSEFLEFLPSRCLINKGITGCGGTTLELICNRDSIILCPTINLVLSKSALGYFGVTGKVSRSEISRYISQEKGYKKIIATYNALEKLMEVIPDYKEYFLLIDEYHLLFNDYSFRNDVILSILDNFRKFKNWAFLTATPLKEECILKELQDIDRITYEWKSAIPVDMKIIDTRFVKRELLSTIESMKDRNLHIFLNSVKTVSSIMKDLGYDYRVVCSENNKKQAEKFARITDPVKKLNFYTSCAFEGADIIDPDGYTIVVCDTSISTTVLDISTKIRQICGRLRDSKYKNQCLLILNTSRHRYAGVSKEAFEENVRNSELIGLRKLRKYNEFSEEDKMNEHHFYEKNLYSNYYINFYEDRLFYDVNLKKMDIYNYRLVTEIYDTSISVLTEAQKNFSPVLNKNYSKKGLTWIKEALRESRQDEFTYQELEEIFLPLFKIHHLIWNKNTSITRYFPKYNKRIKQTKGVRETTYRFIL